MTAFATHRLDYMGRHLWVDGNSKVTSGNGSFDRPEPNAFSLVEIADCPFSTPTCREACYVAGPEMPAELRACYAHNSLTIREILESASERAGWAYALGSWIEFNCKGGRDIRGNLARSFVSRDSDRRARHGGFRWHVSGDIFSEQYAEWIGDVVFFSQSVRHWIYTRSFEHLGPLLCAPKLTNLTINLSCDRDNYERARETRERYAGVKNLRLCYLTIDGSFPANLPPGSVIFPDYSLRGRQLDEPTSAPWWQGLSTDARKKVCPADFFGQSESIRCGVCTKCIDP